MPKKEKHKHGPKHGWKDPSYNTLRRKKKKEQKVKNGVPTIQIRRDGELIEVAKGG